MTRIVIVVEGGIVRGVYSDDENTDVELLDYDTDVHDELLANERMLAQAQDTMMEVL